MIVLARALLDRDPNPDRAAIRNWMGANICRCTGYEMIIEAVEKAASMVRADAE
jgi:carbon-monoxide dehydrogenase small subunit